MTPNVVVVPTTHPKSLKMTITAKYKMNIEDTVVIAEAKMEDPRSLTADFALRIRSGNGEWI